MRYESNALAVANYFIKKANKDKDTVDLLKINKLVYIAYGFFYAITKKHLYQERIEAWKWGPVIPTVYHTFKHNGKNPIIEVGKDFDCSTEKETIPEIAKPSENKNILKVLYVVFEIYKTDTGSTLINKTHGKNTPWSYIYKKGERNREIPKDIIELYYKNILDNKELRDDILFE